MMNNRDFIAKRAAAYFKPGDVVNLGIGIPSLCGSYAVSGVLFQSENGFIGIGPKAEGLMVNERYANAGGVNFVPVPGSSAFDVAASFCVIRSGRLAATVLGGLQVSADGDLANWATPGRAFGMGGAMDLCNGAKNVIVAMELVAKDGSPKIVNQPHCHRPLRHRRHRRGPGALRDPEGPYRGGDPGRCGAPTDHLTRAEGNGGRLIWQNR